MVLGRTVREERPAFGGGTLTNTSVYAANGLLTRTTSPGTVPTLYEYGELARRYRTTLHVNSDGYVDLNGHKAHVLTFNISARPSTRGNRQTPRSAIAFHGFPPPSRYTHICRSNVRYWMASLMWSPSISSAPSRSAMVRATLRMRS